MWRSEWTLVAGLTVTILLALVSVPVFLQGQQGFGLLALILALLLLAATNYLYRLAALPPYTILNTHTLIQILDPVHARWRKTITLRANQEDLQHYVHRNLSADGIVHEDFRVDPEATLVHQHRLAGDYNLTVHFTKPLRRFSKIVTWIEADLEGTFEGTSEAVILLVDQPIKSATIEIVFPPQRLPIASRMIYRYSGREEELKGPRIDGNRIIWAYSVRFGSIRYGAYEARWDW